jgi:hypothetical protein
MTNNSKKFRLYYNRDGSPRCYTMEKLRGKFIYVDQQTYDVGRYDVIVVDGKLRSLSENLVFKYHPDDKSADAVTDPDDILLVTDKRGEHKLWSYRLAN